ncbi:hypothetical protein [uncultured Sphingomonas sp.]|uniref:hypothetical protein n=1 Tax=uncultured Sphingomonas sp. TaxID=158754 RepID=UPI003748ECBA
MSGEGIDKNRGGRPSERGEAKRAPINMRTTPAIRAALEDAATRGGRSLAQEIEQRLERSIEDEQRRGGPATAALIAAILADIAEIEEATGKTWHKDIATYGAVRLAISEQIADRMPVPAELVRKARLDMAGANAVGRVRDAIAAGALYAPEGWDDAKAASFEDNAYDAADDLLNRYDNLAKEGEHVFAEIQQRRALVMSQRVRRRGA